MNRVEKGDMVATPMDDNNNKGKEVDSCEASQHPEEASMEVQEDSTTSMKNDNKEADNSEPSQHPEKASMEVEHTRV
jgi:hypothetical protein